MKRLIPILTVMGLSLASPYLLATSPSPTSTTNKSTAMVGKKEAVAACKKEGKVGKQLNECIKEKTQAKPTAKAPESPSTPSKQ